MFKCISYENLKEGELIQFFGVHVFAWEDDIRPMGIEPTVAFVEDDTLEQENKRMRDALEEIVKAWQTPMGPVGTRMKDIQARKINELGEAIIKAQQDLGIVPPPSQ